MKTSEQFKDWVFRYQYIYNSRKSDHKKERFIHALLKDIVAFRTDVTVVESTQAPITRDLYIGDVKKAKRIICTYYDTPMEAFGAYTFFDTKKQAKKTLAYLYGTSLLLFVLGVCLTLTYIRFTPHAFDFSSPITWLSVLGFGLYFLGLRHVTKGSPVRKNLIRNTSSILAILEMSRQQEVDTAYMLIDRGCYGLENLNEHKRINPNAQWIYLDSIGAHAPLHRVDKQEKTGKTTYIFAAQQKNQHYYLSKKQLKERYLNMENLTQVFKWCL